LLQEEKNSELALNLITAQNCKDKFSLGNASQFFFFSQEFYCAAIVLAIVCLSSRRLRADFIVQ
jgi:hypothetical protein